MDISQIAPTNQSDKSPIAALVERLIDAGCDPSVAASVVAETYALATMSLGQIAVQKRRVFERDRKRKYRSLSQGHVPGQSVNHKQNHKVDSGTLSQGHEKPLYKEVSKKDFRLVANRLSGTWSLPEPCRLWALSQGLTEQEIAGQAETFKDYWTAKAGKDATKTDWVATWRNWCRKFLQDRGRTAAPERVNGKEGDARYGWKPGLPTSEELRAQYAKKTI